MAEITVAIPAIPATAAIYEHVYGVRTCIHNEDGDMVYLDNGDDIFHVQNTVQL